MIFIFSRLRITLAYSPFLPEWLFYRAKHQYLTAGRVAYRWDGDQLVGQQQYLADGTAARAVQWVYEPGSFRPLAQVEGKGDVTRLHYIVTDLTGTARELCSEEGEVHWRGEQALWGNHREERWPTALDGKEERQLIILYPIAALQAGIQ